MQDELPKVLAIDDDPTALKLFVGILGEFCDIHVSSNGKNGLDLAQEIVPDLILLDINMPVMDGFTLCRKLKENQKTESKPVIFLTSSDEKKDITQGIKLGIVDYLIKPLNKHTLQERVFFHLAKESIFRMYSVFLENLSLQEGQANLFGQIKQLYNMTDLLRPIKQ